MQRWVGSLKNNHKLGVSAWSEFECLTTGSNEGCRQHRNEPWYTKSTGIGNVSDYQLLTKSSAPWQKQRAVSNLLTDETGEETSVTY